MWYDNFSPCVVQVLLCLVDGPLQALYLPVIALEHLYHQTNLLVRVGRLYTPQHSPEQHVTAHLRSGKFGIPSHNYCTVLSDQATSLYVLTQKLGGRLLFAANNCKQGAAALPRARHVLSCCCNTDV